MGMSVRSGKVDLVEGPLDVDVRVVAAIFAHQACCDTEGSVCSQVCKFPKVLSCLSDYCRMASYGLFTVAEGAGAAVVGGLADISAGLDEIGRAHV